MSAGHLNKLAAPPTYGANFAYFWFTKNPALVLSVPSVQSSQPSTQATPKTGSPLPPRALPPCRLTTSLSPLSSTYIRQDRYNCAFRLRQRMLSALGPDLATADESTTSVIETRQITTSNSNNVNAERVVIRQFTWRRSRPGLASGSRPRWLDRRRYG